MQTTRSKSSENQPGITPAAIRNEGLAIQMTLTVGAVNDPLEAEADAMADRVMRMPEPDFTLPIRSNNGHTIQKQDDKTATTPEKEKPDSSRLSVQPSQPDFLSLRKPFLERNAYHLWDPDSALGVWKYNLDFFKRLGLSENWAGKAANLTAPFAIDAQLKADNPKWWEITDRELQTTSIMGSIPLLDFDANFRNWRPLPFLQKKALQTSSEIVQRKSAESEEEDEQLQRKPLASQITPFIQAKSSEGNTQVGDAISSRIESTRGEGSPLPEAPQSFMESRFGADFSGVQVHSGGYANQLSRDLNAKAFTVGADIYFNSGEYHPGDKEGKRLLAHELTHVMQQTGAGNGGQPESGVLQRQVSFTSSGQGVRDETEKRSEPVERYRQTEVLHKEDPVANPTYGLECLGVAILYMIQSYGLVPPDMSRQEFEHAFTPLTPPAHGSPKIGWIKVGGKEQIGALPVNLGALPVDLFSNALEGTPNPPKTNNNSLGYPATKTEATLQGAKRGGFKADYVVKKLPEIFRAFHAQAQKPGYEFMQAHRPYTEAFKPEAMDEWVATADLNNNSIGDEYFQKGNTLMVELSLSYPTTSEVWHRCVIVGKAKYTIIDTAGQNHYLYPADDPWYGPTLVMVPPDTDGWLERDPTAGVSIFNQSAGLLKYRSQTVLLVAKGNNHIYRRKI